MATVVSPVFWLMVTELAGVPHSCSVVTVGSSVTAADRGSSAGVRVSPPSLCCCGLRTCWRMGPECLALSSVLTVVGVEMTLLRLKKAFLSLVLALLFAPPNGVAAVEETGFTCFEKGFIGIDDALSLLSAEELWFFFPNPPNERGLRILPSLYVCFFLSGAGGASMAAAVGGAEGGGRGR